ncbi:MAG: hypothetical protein NVSMB5_05710 [Candidatus Velthaea sp.]
MTVNGPLAEALATIGVPPVPEPLPFEVIVPVRPLTLALDELIAPNEPRMTVKFVCMLPTPEAMFTPKLPAAALRTFPVNVAVGLTAVISLIGPEVV